MSVRKADAMARESGFTLVELIVYSGLSVLVLTLVGGMFFSAIAAENRIRARAEAASLSQVISRSIHAAVRNASWTEVSADGRFLAADCQAWSWVDRSGVGVLRSKTVATKTDIPTSASPGEGWRDVGTGILAMESTPRIFTKGGSTVAVKFQVALPEGADPVQLTTTVSSRQTAAGTKDGATC